MRRASAAKLCYGLLLACIPASMLLVVGLPASLAQPLHAEHPSLAGFLDAYILPRMPSWPQYLAVQTLAALIAGCGLLYGLGGESALVWKRLGQRVLFTALVAGYAAWAGLSYLWSAWPYGTRGYFIRELPFYFLCLAAAFLCAREERWLTYAKVFATAAFAEAALQGILVVQAAHGTGQTFRQAFQDSALFYSNVNAACAVVLTGSFIVVGFAINNIVEAVRKRGPVPSSTILLWTAAPIALAAFGFIVIAAGSLAGYLAAGLGAFAYALCVLPLRRRWPAVLAVGAVGAACIVAIIASDALWVKSLRFVLAPERTTSLRVVDWIACKELYLRRPVQGWGMGTFPATYAQFQPPLARRLPFTQGLRTTHPHSEFARIAADQGLVGLALYAAILIYAFTVSYRALRRRALKTRLVGYALWAGGLAFVVHCTFGREPMMWSFSANYWLLLGVLASAAYWPSGEAPAPARPAAEERLKPEPAAWAVWALAAASLAWAWWTWGVGGYESIVALNRSTAAQLQMHVPGKAQAEFREFRQALDEARPRCLWTEEILYGDYVIGWFETAHSEWTKGAQQLEKVLMVAPDFLDSRLFLAECYMGMGQPGDAMVQVEGYLAQNPYLLDDGPTPGSSPAQVDEYLRRDAAKVTGYDVVASLAGLDAATRVLEEHVVSRLALPKDWVVEDYATPREVRKLLDFYAQGGRWDKARALAAQVEGFFRTTQVRRAYDVRQQVRLLARTYAVTGRQPLARELEAALPEAFARAPRK